MDSPISILITEHDDSNFFVLHESLRAFPLNYIRCNSGSELLSHIQTNNTIKLVLIDIHLYGQVDGIEISKQIRVLRPDLPLILYTAYLFPNEVTCELRSHFDDFLIKPFKINDLISLVKKHIDLNVH